MHESCNNLDEVTLGIDCTEQKVDVPELENAQNAEDTQPRVTENAPEEAGESICEPVCTVSSNARILTIPGATYRVSAFSDTYTEPIAPTPLPICEADVLSDTPPGISYPAVADEPDVDAAKPELYREIDYNAKDDGYSAPVEYNEDERVSDEPHPISIPYDPSHEEKEYERFLAENDREAEDAPAPKPVFEDSDADTFDLPVDKVDKSVKLVEARMCYEIATMKAQHRMLGYTFSIDVLKKDRTDRKLRRQINDRMYKLSRALKRERADTTRYYTAALDKYAGDEGRRTANEARIASLLERLGYALKEREQIEESLMRLYGEETVATSATKEMKVAERAAKTAYRSQLKLAKRVARMHAPDELKEKIFTIMNERVALLSAIEKNKYLISKKRYTGADKRSVKRKNREMKRTVRQKEDDLVFFVKKAEKHHAEHGNGMRQIAWLIGTVMVLGAIGVLYFVAKYNWGWF